MSDEVDPPFNPDRLRLDTGEVWAAVPKKVKTRNEHFVRMPWTWVRRLSGATSQTWVVACHILYLDWIDGGSPVMLGNGMLKIDGVPPTTKYRALRDLVRRGLIAVEWRSKKSPIVRRLM